MSIVREQEYLQRIGQLTQERDELKNRIALRVKAMKEVREICFWHENRCYTILRSKYGAWWNCYRGNACLDLLKDPNAKMTDYRTFEEAWAAVEEAMKAPDNPLDSR